MKKQIQILLNISSEEYDDKTLDLWIRYSQFYSTNKGNDWQKLLANKSLNAFFLNQKKRLEKQFLQNFKAYKGDASKIDINRAYNFEVCVRLFTYRSPALIASARKLTINPQLN